jgi:hypothetical protein
MVGGIERFNDAVNASLYEEEGYKETEDLQSVVFFKQITQQGFKGFIGILGNGVDEHFHETLLEIADWQVGDQSKQENNGRTQSQQKVKGNGCSPDIE